MKRRGGKILAMLKGVGSPTSFGVVLTRELEVFPYRSGGGGHKKFPPFKKEGGGGGVGGMTSLTLS